MQKNKKNHRADLEKNVSQADGQTDRCRVEQELCYSTPSTKVEVRSRFSEIRE